MTEPTDTVPDVEPIGFVTGDPYADGTTPPPDSGWPAEPDERVVPEAEVPASDLIIGVEYDPASLLEPPT